MFYMMSQNQPASCEPEHVYVPVQPIEQPAEETVFRTWRVDADGTKTLMDESTEQ